MGSSGDRTLRLRFLRGVAGGASLEVEVWVSVTFSSPQDLCVGTPRISDFGEHNCVTENSFITGNHPNASGTYSNFLVDYTGFHIRRGRLRLG